MTETASNDGDETPSETPSETDRVEVLSLPKRTARLDVDEGTSLEDEPGPWTINGVALGEDELTQDLEHGSLLWPSETLRAAASTLEGQPVTAGHPSTEDGFIEYPPSLENTIGRVTSVGYEDGVGIVYEATLSDRDVARKVRDGILDVSPDVSHSIGDEDPETGATRVDDALFIQLGIVSKGAGPQNSVQLGPSRALASLSAADIQTMLDNKQTADGETSRLDSDDPSDHPRASAGDAVRWPSSSGGSREPSEWRYGVVVDGLEDGAEDEILVAVYQPDSDRESWEPRDEQNVMNPDNLIPIGDGVAALPAISQLSDFIPPVDETPSVEEDEDEDEDDDQEDDEDDEESEDSDQSDQSEGSTEERSDVAIPRGDDAHPVNDGQSTSGSDGEDGDDEGANDADDAGDEDRSEDGATDDGSDRDGTGDQTDDADADESDEDDDIMSEENTGADDPVDDVEEQSGSDRKEKRSRQRLEDVKGERDSAKARLSDAHEEIDTLKKENSRLSDVVNGAAEAYADALFGSDSGPVTPEMAVDRWTPAELKEMYDDSEDASLVEESDADPDVQGVDEDPAEGASSEGSLDEEDREKIERLEDSIEEAKRQELHAMADHYESRLAEIREGGD